MEEASIPKEMNYNIDDSFKNDEHHNKDNFCEVGNGARTFLLNKKNQKSSPDKSFHKYPKLETSEQSSAKVVRNSTSKTASKITKYSNKKVQSAALEKEAYNGTPNYRANKEKNSDLFKRRKNIEETEVKCKHTIKQIDQDTFDRLNKHSKNIENKCRKNVLNPERNSSELNRKPKLPKFQPMPIPDKAPSMFAENEQFYNRLASEIQSYYQRTEPEIESYLRYDFISKGPTRAQKLKEQTNRRLIEKKEAEVRRQKLNDEIRRQTEEAAAKRIEKPLHQLRCLDNPGKRARDLRTKMRNDYEEYMNQLKTMKETNGVGQTLLERIAEDLNHPKMPVDQIDY